MVVAEAIVRGGERAGGRAPAAPVSGPFDAPGAWRSLGSRLPGKMFQRPISRRRGDDLGGGEREARPARLRLGGWDGPRGPKALQLLVL